MGGSGSFRKCAQRLSAELAINGSQPSASDYTRVRSALNLILRARFISLRPDQIADVTDGTIERLIRESRRQQGPLDNAAGWLVTVAANLALDLLRGNDPYPHLMADGEGTEEDEATQLFERLTAVDHVDGALADAIAAGDDTCVIVVTTWLDMAEQLGEAPPSRAVAEESGYSHTTVLKALARFARFVSS